jgi:hypothetical protein
VLFAAELTKAMGVEVKPTSNDSEHESFGSQLGEAHLFEKVDKSCVRTQRIEQRVSLGECHVS